MWDPTRLSCDIVDQYLKALSYHWGVKSGLTEEIALKYLQLHSYDINKAIGETIEYPTKLKALIKEMNKHAEKIETVAFIGSLLD